jgi:myo-inositol-1(or 4)-monophosphatase
MHDIILIKGNQLLIIKSATILQTGRSSKNFLPERGGLLNINTLRRIGTKLLKEISSLKEGLKTVVGVGASGDKTYQIDKLAEDIILSNLEKSGDSLSVISEEAGLKDIKGGGKRVVIDPIDGSRNAVTGIPFYCTSIAIADGNTVGDIELAYVLNLVNGDEFWAEKGKGAFLNEVRLFSQQDDVLYLVAYEAQVPGKDITRMMPLLSEARKTRCLGSTALDLSYLARGSISIFANPSASRGIDFAGGWLIVGESGGIFTDMEGSPIDAVELGIKRATSLLVSGNRKLHAKALEFLMTHG